MVFPKARMVVSGCLFVAWIGFLAVLVARTRQPVILSRPQLLDADAVIIATLSEKDGKPDPTVTVKEVLRSGKTISPQARITYLEFADKEQGYREPGDYLLPLTVGDDGVLAVTTMPVVPGYAPPRRIVKLVSIGSKAAEVQELAKEFSGRADKIEAGSVLRPFAPAQEAEAFATKARGLGAEVLMYDAEIRIYPVKEETLREYRALEAEWKR